ncbi:5-formyltetrahydrofolate cyclo-ligase [Hufsiella ginkgonis]|uniref:5-formyltetrahydrofolate cyclo-ligase n=1 Tax=Hufsiella ginkgonis TaxID=2695274 RepID=A0A7K1XVK3_9SPHI|nr:5-formyltetrahydrofolate cyclo-ligase [Hufsiella ginkgonis]MXV14546.1 5-formyltetrahydrofolate cyclo-ligase [Hufsiella ginkgonis]
MDKAELRKRYLAKRKQLSPVEINDLNTALVARFAQIKLEGIGVVHVFYPIPGKIEPDSLRIVNYLREEHPGIRLVLPKSNLDMHTLTHILWTEDTPLAMNRWGITEPEQGEAVDPQSIDLVLIPLLAYDTHGNRVGYGKGFYDRFLASCRPGVVKAGISWFPPEELVTDADPFDVPLDLCIHPKRVIYFRRGNLL